MVTRAIRQSGGVNGEARPGAQPRLAASGGLMPANLVRLQRLAGNAAVTGLLRPTPGGSTTRPLPEAPPTAELAEGSVPTGVADTVGPFGATLLRAASTTVTRPTTRPALGTGSALPDPVRRHFESAFGYDLGFVRVHRDPAATAASAGYGARAATVGDHVLFGEGQYDPGSSAGMFLIGHELTHTLQHRKNPDPGRGGVSSPGSPAEREADRVGGLAAAGERVEVWESASEDAHRVIWWLVAGAAVLAGLIWAASPSPEENRARHEQEGGTNELMMWIPVVGSVAQIYEADSYFQRVLGVGFLCLDAATLGSAGLAGKALIRVGGSVLRRGGLLALREAGGVIAEDALRAAEREGGKIVADGASRVLTQAGERFAAEGGVVIARDAAAEEISRALSQGSIVAVSQGALNHSMLYVKIGNAIHALHGGPLRLFIEETPRLVSPAEQAAGMVRRVNTYAVIETTRPLTIESLREVGEGLPAILRWLGGNPTSCGIIQGALLEHAGLDAAKLARYIPGLMVDRLLPITIGEHWVRQGGGRIIEGGMSRIIGGTVLTGTALGAAAATGVVADVGVHMVFNSAPDWNARQATGRAPREPSGTPVERAAQRVVDRWGPYPTEAMYPAIRADLPRLYPGWYVLNEAAQTEFRDQLVLAGMDGRAATAVTAAPTMSVAP